MYFILLDVTVTLPWAIDNRFVNSANIEKQSNKRLPVHSTSLDLIHRCIEELTAYQFGLQSHGLLLHQQALKTFDHPRSDSLCQEQPENLKKKMYNRGLIFQFQPRKMVTLKLLCTLNIYGNTDSLVFRDYLSV